jgi:hypothetical protein
VNLSKKPIVAIPLPQTLLESLLVVIARVLLGQQDESLGVGRECAAVDQLVKMIGHEAVGNTSN